MQWNVLISSWKSCWFKTVNRLWKGLSGFRLLTWRWCYVDGFITLQNYANMRVIVTTLDETTTLMICITRCMYICLRGQGDTAWRFLSNKLASHRTYECVECRKIIRRLGVSTQTIQRQPEDREWIDNISYNSQVFLSMLSWRHSESIAKYFDLKSLNIWQASFQCSIQFSIINYAPGIGSWINL